MLGKAVLGPVISTCGMLIYIFAVPMLGLRGNSFLCRKSTGNCITSVLGASSVLVPCQMHFNSLLVKSSVCFPTHTSDPSSNLPGLAEHSSADGPLVKALKQMLNLAGLSLIHCLPRAVMLSLLALRARWVAQSWCVGQIGPWGPPLLLPIPVCQDWAHL